MPRVRKNGLFGQARLPSWPRTQCPGTRRNTGVTANQEIRHRLAGADQDGPGAQNSHDHQRDARRRAAVNFQRGLFRLWIVVSVAWVLILGSYDRVWCAFGDMSALWCSKHQIYVEGAWRELAGVFGIPLA
jgi:hypothetical protein